MRRIRLWCFVGAALASGLCMPRIAPAQAPFFFEDEKPAAVNVQRPQPKRMNAAAPTDNPFAEQFQAPPKTPVAPVTPPATLPPRPRLGSGFPGQPSPVPNPRVQLPRETAPQPAQTPKALPPSPFGSPASLRVTQPQPSPAASVKPAPGATQSVRPLPDQAGIFNRPTTARINATGPTAGANTTPLKTAPYVRTYENQTPSLTVDWVTPETILMGSPGDFELVLRNRGLVAIEQVMIEKVLPAGFMLIKSTPEPQDGLEKPSWSLPALAPNEEARISLRLKPVKAGPATSEARVTFTTASATKFNVVEPKLKLTADAPESVIVGNQAILNIVVENPGSGPTTNTVLNVAFADGLVPVARSTTYEIGTLNAGESRSVRVLANVAKLGDHACNIVCTADNGLRAQQPKKIRGLGAVLAMSIDGPTFRYVNRPATFQVHVRNNGTAPAENVHVRCAVPNSFAFMDAKDFGKFDAASKTVNWYLDQIPAGGQTVLTCDMRALDRGKFPIIAGAQAERGLRASASHDTRVEGIAAILLEVVDIDDPVEVGAETAYQILVTNQGTDFATNIKLEVNIPEGMIVNDVKGPSNGAINKNVITFQPIPKLAPRADAIFRIFVRGTKPGDYRLSVNVQSDTLKSPVTEEESTKIYQD